MNFAGKDIFELFGKTISNINPGVSFNEAIAELLNCKGKIITSGMGKAGNAMLKFSSILCSLGFPSAYLHPGESAHGDLGLIGKDDILFLASTSGQTREILEIIDLSRNINVGSIIGITSHKDSPLREKVDIVIDMGPIQEAKVSDDFDLPPTTSILVMLAITDAIAILMARAKGVTKEDYSKYHHGGYLGKQARREI